MRVYLFLQHFVADCKLFGKRILYKNYNSQYTSICVFSINILQKTFGSIFQVYRLDMHTGVGAGAGAGTAN